METAPWPGGPALALKFSIQDASSDESSRFWAESAVCREDSEPVSGGTVPASGWRSFLFLPAKFCRSLEGIPAVTLHWCWTSF